MVVSQSLLSLLCVCSEEIMLNFIFRGKPNKLKYCTHISIYLLFIYLCPLNNFDGCMCVFPRKYDCVRYAPCEFCHGGFHTDGII